jgi:hypothetical protein
MPFILQPWHIPLVDQRQQQILEFQNAQIEALLKKRLLYTFRMMLTPQLTAAFSMKSRS